MLTHFLLFFRGLYVILICSNQFKYKSVDVVGYMYIITMEKILPKYDGFHLNIHLLVEVVAHLIAC